MLTELPLPPPLPQPPDLRSQVRYSDTSMTTQHTHAHTRVLAEGAGGGEATSKKRKILYWTQTRG